MQVTFVALGMEQLGIGQLAALARRDGHEVGLAYSAALFDDRYNLRVPRLSPWFDDRDQVIQAIVDQQPDVIAFSPLTGTYRWMLSVAEEARQLLPETRIVFGGVHASAVPDRVLAQPFVDYVCVGEGDVAFPEILRAVQRGGATAPIPNTRFRAPDGQVVRGPQTGFVQDLDALPFCDKEIWEDHVRIGDFYMLMAARGCPYRCTFCFNNFFANLPENKREKGRYVRQRSVEHVMHELLLAKRRYRLRFVDFEDDVFTVDKDWIRAFLDRYRREIGLPFHCLVHPRYMDDEIASHLANAGCSSVQMGIQSADDEYKYQSVRRYEKTETVERALDAMIRHKLRVKCDHMFDLPGEPAGAQESARRLYAEHTPYRIQSYWTNLLPGVEMVDQVLKAGLATREQVDRLEEGFDCDFFASNLARDPERARTFKGYETLFKLMPLLPKTWRDRVRPELFSRLPAPVCTALGIGVDAVHGLGSGSHHHVAYARHYAHHLWCWLRRKLGLRPPKATRTTPALPIGIRAAGLDAD
ncbi:MAG: radical SAM protein [Myxococcota bacterium]|nr:radical SAM protein [Myxococcota bacterium]